jgi:fructose/tagatose bisphosphate aldolase
MAHEKVKEALAENTAQMKVLADRYVAIWARAGREIEAEKEKPVPSQWKIEAMKRMQERVEEKIAQFKGADRLADDQPKEF